MFMHRRLFMGSAIAAGSLTAFAGPARAAVGTPARRFDITTTVDLHETHAAAQLWVPVFHSDPAYQQRLGLSWQGSGRAKLARDPATGAPILHAHWAEGEAPRQLVLTQRIATWERSASAAAHLSAAERAQWTAATPGIPTDGIVGATARGIVGHVRDPKLQVRALYDWVVLHSWRDPATPGCGTGDVSAMLKDGHMGGKCADINSLMVALTRAIGIPARDVYGIRTAPSALFTSLGRGGGDITTAQHCRAEVWLDGTGWFAVDPADVRKAVLEEKLPVDSAPIKALTDRLFGAWEDNWAGYNSASALTLPGAAQTPEFHFLMYPAAMTRETVCMCLDAPRFAYKITSEEVKV